MFLWSRKSNSGAASLKTQGRKIANKEVRNTDTTVKINIDNDSLDMTIEKANQLVELLREAQQIVGCLSGKEELKP